MTAPLSDALLAEIEARWQAVTPSPWRQGDAPFPGRVWADAADSGTGGWIATDAIPADADAIAHAPDDVRLLLREVRRLKAEMQALPTPDDWEEFAARALATAIVETELDLSDMEWGALEHLLRFEFHTQSPDRAAMDRP